MSIFRTTRWALIYGSLVSSAYAPKKMISLSFDDAPMGSSIGMSGKVRSQKIVNSLRESKVEQVIFYANPGNIKNQEGAERLRFYKSSGHLIGNHTWGHEKASESSYKTFIESFEKTDKFLKDNQVRSKYFRFPYLNRGSSKKNIKKIGEHIFNTRKYIDGYVTIDNWDWYMNNLYQNALRKKKKIDLKNLEKFYVSTLLKSVDFYSELSKKVLGADVPQVLLLHENDLAALFLSDLVKTLREKGWEIVSPEKSYRSSVLSSIPDTTKHGQGRIVSYALANGYEGKTRSGLENYEVLKKRFEKFKVVLSE